MQTSLLHYGMYCTCVTVIWALWSSAGALKALSEKGIVHRDLKPQNILLCHDNQRNPQPPDIMLKIGDLIVVLVRFHSLLACCGVMTCVITCDVREFKMRSRDDNSQSFISHDTQCADRKLNNKNWNRKLLSEIKLLNSLHICEISEVGFV